MILGKKFGIASIKLKRNGSFLERPKGVTVKKPNAPKVLIFDIETAPNLAYVWGKWEQNVIDYHSEWYMLCYAWKWLGESSVKAASLQDWRCKDDRELVKSLWRLFDEADVVIAHNGDAFDVKKTQARFLFHGLKPPSPVVTVDTKKVARRYFNFNSNKLDDLGKTLGVGRKVKHSGFEVWLGCMRNDKKYWKEMIHYNKQDVTLLEKVYLKMLPWMKTHPNLAFLSGKSEGCPNCGSSKLKSYGIRRTKSSAYRRLRCLKCSAFSRVRVPLSEAA